MIERETSLKLLHDLRIIQDHEPNVSFGWVPAFHHLLKSYTHKSKSTVKGLNQAVDSYCHDLTPAENQKVKGTLVTLLAQNDPIFSREWLIEMALTGHPFSEMMNFCAFVLKWNKNLNEQKK